MTDGRTDGQTDGRTDGRTEKKTTKNAENGCRNLTTKNTILLRVLALFGTDQPPRTCRISIFALGQVCVGYFLKTPHRLQSYYLLIEPFLSFFIPLTSNPLSVSWAEEGSGVDRLGLTLNLLLERDGVGRDEWRGWSRPSL